jgi:hypothetical protein
VCSYDEVYSIQQLRYHLLLVTKIHEFLSQQRTVLLIIDCIFDPIFCDDASEVFIVGLFTLGMAQGHFIEGT